ncbi:DsbA family protein [Pseudomonadota bacterium]
MSDTCAIDGLPPDQGPSDEFDPGPGKHVLFFGDPMCSWCWGFAPELQKIHAACDGLATFHVIMGGLRPGTVETWDQAMRDYIRHHWEEVEAKTGQPFDYARFDDESFVYDTEPGCRAVVAARELDPAKALNMYEALQRGFYAEGLDITKPEVLIKAAVTVGYDRARFEEVLTSPEARALVMYDFKRARAFGVTGFPTLMCAEDGQFAALALGYRPYTAIGPLLQEWLNA